MCNDCLAESVVIFHVLGGKCYKCNSYNTTRIDKGDGKNLILTQPQPDTAVDGQSSRSWESCEEEVEEGIINNSD